MRGAMGKLLARRLSIRLRDTFVKIIFAITPRPDVCESEHGIRQPYLEAFIIHELLEQFGVILHYERHHTHQSLVLLDIDWKNG